MELPLAALLVSVAALLGALGSALYVRFSGPIAAARDLRDLLTRVRDVEAVLEDIGIRWEKYRESVESLLEELQQTEERVERGRRKTAQAAARLDRKKPGGDGAAISDDSYEGLLVRARNQGHSV